MIYETRNVVNGVQMKYRPLEEGKKYTYLITSVPSTASLENDGTLIPTFRDQIRIFGKQVYSNYGSDSVRLAVSPDFKNLIEEIIEDSKNVLIENGQVIETIKTPFKEGTELSVFIKIDEKALQKYQNDFTENESMFGFIRTSVWYGPEKKMLGVNLELRDLKPLTEKPVRKNPPKKRTLQEAVLN